MSDPRGPARQITTVQGRPAGWLEAGAGDGVPLVLLHGACFDHADMSWRNVAPLMAQSRRVIRPDLPGYGATIGFGVPYDLSDLGRWLVAFLDALGLPRVDVAGLSMGGGLALWLALNHPERVRSAVPVCPFGLMRRGPLHSLGLPWAKRPLSTLFYKCAAVPRLARRGLRRVGYLDGAKVLSELVAQLTEVAREQRQKRSFDHFLAGEMSWRGFRTDMTGQLRDLSVPMMIIQGAQDPVIRPRHSRNAARVQPAIRLEMLPGRHLPTCEHPEKVAALMAAFMADSSA